MPSSEPQPQPRQPSRWIPGTILVLGFLGFLDTVYLTAEHFLGAAPRCVLFSGCDVVTTSAYSTIGPVPVALLGAVFYLFVFVLVLRYLDNHSGVLLRLVAYLSILAFLFTLYLVYLQLFVLHAVCVYCMFSALTSTGVFAVSLCTFRSRERRAVV